MHNYSTFTITTYLHYNMHTFVIPALILNTPTYVVLKIPHSWLFHITIICISEYNVEKIQNKITIHFIIFLILQRIDTTIWIWKSLQSIFFNFIEKFNQNITKFHVFLKWNQNKKIKSMVYQKIYMCFFCYKIPAATPWFPKLCV